MEKFVNPVIGELNQGCITDQQWGCEGQDHARVYGEDCAELAGTWQMKIRYNIKKIKND
jgi:hypothetical protein